MVSAVIVRVVGHVYRKLAAVKGRPQGVRAGPRKAHLVERRRPPWWGGALGGSVVPAQVCGGRVRGTQVGYHALPRFFAATKGQEFQEAVKVWRAG